MDTANNAVNYMPKRTVLVIGTSPKLGPFKINAVLYNYDIHSFDRKITKSYLF